MFEHSVKVPRHFKVAANIVKKVSTEGGSVKALLYDDKLRHFRTNVLYALINETIKHAAEIDKIFQSCDLLTNEPRLDPWLAKVLTADLLFGKKELPGNSKPVQTILSYKDQFEKHSTNIEDSTKTKAIRRPRYVRINTNLLTTSDAIRAFQDEEYRFVRCTSGSYEDYLKQIQELGEYDFTQDYHVKTVFVFPAGTKLHEHDLYLESKIILQDKATAMAVHLLAPPPGSIALDMCAAPGMKTMQLAAFMRNEGKIYAVERDAKRYQTLCDFVERSGSKCVETINKDCLEIKRGDHDDVEYIILDPSCSGSGMELSVHNYIDATRLSKLTSLQEKFLKHAMNAFPKAKRIVYSTCSLFPEENERVITNVVKASRAKWKVQDVKELLKGQWNNFGSSMYGSMGTRCMYAKPESDLTTGFFLAVLDRDPKDLEKNLNRGDREFYNENTKNDGTNDGDESNCSNETKKVGKKRKRKNDVHYDEIAREETLENGAKKKKKEELVAESTESNSIDEPTNNKDAIIEGGKKKKKKDRRKNQGTQEDVTENVDFDTNNKNSENRQESDYFGNVDSIEVNKAAHTKKKKKKKRQFNETETVSNQEPQESGTENVDFNTNLKNEKNQQKTDDINNVVDQIENDVTGATQTKKKKRHKNETEVLSQESEEPPKTESGVTKKKKKHKNREISLDNKTEIVDDTEISQVPKKKKKKKCIELES